MKIALSADHRGSAAIRQLHEKLRREGKDAAVVGECGGSTCDYPEMAFQVAKAVADGTYDLGVLICGTGIGMSIAANKVKGVRAAVAHDEITAQLSRSHNNANVLCLSADLLGQRLIEKIVDVWLKSEFEGGRHARRLRKIAAMEEGLDPATVQE
ncbi:MAG: ribose 5-phosphate isomerase B [Phycisphaeraceae bacterium]|nr:MAG: ribose 5-phosphate isomerase B [Phycisphaeraceae bacterium]